MSSLDSIQTSLSSIRDVSSAKVAWEQLTALEPRAVSGLALFSRAKIKQLSEQYISAGSAYASAASGYYTGTSVETPVIADLEQESTELYTRLSTLLNLDQSEVPISTSPIRVTNTRIPVPLVNAAYSLLVDGRPTTIEPRLARIYTPGSSVGDPLTGTALVVVGGYVNVVDLDLSASYITDTGEYIEGDETVVCLLVDENTQARRRNALGRGKLQSGVFISPRAVRDALGGTLTQEIVAESFTLLEGRRVDLPDHTRILLDGDEFVVFGGTLLEYITRNRAAFIAPGVYSAQVTRAYLDVPQHVDTQGTIAVEYTEEGGERIAGDLADLDNGTPSTKARLIRAVSLWDTVELVSPPAPVSPRTARLSAEFADTLSAKGGSLLAAHTALEHDTRIHTLLTDFMGRLEKSGLDRAADLLRSADLATFLALNNHEGSYSGYMRALTSRLKVEVQA